MRHIYIIYILTLLNTLKISSNNRPLFLQSSGKGEIHEQNRARVLLSSVHASKDRNEHAEGGGKVSDFHKDNQLVQCRLEHAVAHAVG